MEYIFILALATSFAALLLKEFKPLFQEWVGNIEVQIEQGFSEGVYSAPI